MTCSKWKSDNGTFSLQTFWSLNLIRKPRAPPRMRSQVPEGLCPNVPLVLYHTSHLPVLLLPLLSQKTGTCCFLCVLCSSCWPSQAVWGSVQVFLPQKGLSWLRGKFPTCTCHLLSSQHVWSILSPSLERPLHGRRGVPFVVHYRNWRGCWYTVSILRRLVEYANSSCLCVWPQEEPRLLPDRVAEPGNPCHRVLHHYFV